MSDEIIKEEVIEEATPAVEEETPVEETEVPASEEVAA